MHFVGRHSRTLFKLLYIIYFSLFGLRRMSCTSIRYFGSISWMNSFFVWPYVSLNTRKHGAGTGITKYLMRYSIERARCELFTHHLIFSVSCFFFGCLRFWLSFTERGEQQTYRYVYTSSSVSSAMMSKVYMRWCLWVVCVMVRCYYDVWVWNVSMYMYVLWAR